MHFDKMMLLVEEEGNYGHQMGSTLPGKDLKEILRKIPKTNIEKKINELLN
jgi:hypothetical protein